MLDCVATVDVAALRIDSLRAARPGSCLRTPLTSGRRHIATSKPCLGERYVPATINHNLAVVTVTVTELQVFETPSQTIS